jgi:hypothetical protein
MKRMVSSRIALPGGGGPDVAPMFATAAGGGQQPAVNRRRALGTAPAEFLMELSRPVGCVPLSVRRRGGIESRHSARKPAES